MRGLQEGRPSPNFLCSFLDKFQNKELPNDICPSDQNKQGYARAGDNSILNKVRNSSEQRIYH
jgi:hypothetical protein